MTAGRPVSAETRARIVNGFALGLGRNEIARRVGLAGSVITRIAAEEGHEFDRSMTALAVAAHSIDLAKERAALAEMALVRAREALEDMDSPVEVAHWSETGEAWRVTTLDRPTDSDRRNLATVFGILTQKSTELTRAADGAGVAEGASVLGALGSIFTAAADALSDVDPTAEPE